MLTIVRGRTFSFDATIFDTYVAEGDPGNVPTNHTGWTIRSQIRKKIGNVLVANLNVTFPVPTAGTVAIRHDRVFTRSLPVGDYWWDIVATDPSGIDHDYIEPEPIAVHDHPTDPANAVYDFVPGGGGAIHHTHSISDITGLQALLDDRLPPDGGTIARYLRGDNTWQLLNKAAVGLSLVENVTLSTWIGSSNITRLGTIISGAWQGSRIAPAYLGDGTDIETKFLRGDGTWQTVSGGGGGAYIDLTDAATVNLPSINTALAFALSGKAATSHTHTASQISDSTATGRAILTAATQSDARTTGLGSGATGDQLFQAASASAARTTLGFDGMVPKIPFTVGLESDFTTPSTSFVNVTGVSFPVEANKRYAVNYYILTNKNDTAGLAIQFTGPASPTKVSLRQFVGTTSFANAVANLVTAFSTPSTTFNTFNGDSLATAASGIIDNGANAGTVQLQLRAVTGGTAKIYAGSYIQITEL